MSAVKSRRNQSTGDEKSNRTGKEKGPVDLYGSTIKAM